LKGRWDEATTTRANRRAAFVQKIGAFLDELAAVRILDPACYAFNVSPKADQCLCRLQLVYDPVSRVT